MKTKNSKDLIYKWAICKKPWLRPPIPTQLKANRLSRWFWISLSSRSIHLHLESSVFIQQMTSRPCVVGEAWSSHMVDEWSVEQNSGGTLSESVSVCVWQAGVEACEVQEVGCVQQEPLEIACGPWVEFPSVARSKELRIKIGNSIWFWNSLFEVFLTKLELLRRKHDYARFPSF